MKRLFRQWWPVDEVVPSPPAPLEAGDTKLKYGERPQLVELQPYILRWALLCGAFTLLYSVTRWLPQGTVRLVFGSVVLVLWLVSGAAFVALLLMQQRRREEAERDRTKPPAAPTPTSSSSP